MDTSATRIAELIKTNPGYSAQVDLNQWFPDSVKNLATMRRYSPMVSHRQAFERIAGALDSKDKRVYLITGNYGSGKSHLCLMLANYFAYPSDQADVAQFLNNYAQEDSPAANKLRARRKKGRYLVALCDYDSTDDFGEVVLRAVLNALQEIGLADTLETPYAEARRKLEQLEADRESGQALVDYYGLFEQHLPHHLAGTNMKAFKQKLDPGLDHTALEVFKRLHREILRSPFTYEAGNLSAILRSTLASPAFREQFEGIVVFWDEFGYTLGNPNRLSLNVFQQFAQLCTEFDPKRGKLVFIATAHRDFSAYAPAWAAADYSKIRDRVEQVNLLPEGLEDVIGAIVAPDKAHPLWQQEVFPKANPVWSQWVPASKSSGIFKWLVSKPPVFHDKILEGVYPLHPMATYAVIELAREVASQNRTVFTFFSSEKEDVYEDGSYLWYIHEFPLTAADGQLHFYTVDRLFDYFRPRLRTDNPDLTPRAKERIANYEASLTQLLRARNQNPLELSQADLIERILRTMLIYDLIDVHNSAENLLFGLNLQPGGKAALEWQLVELAKFGVVHRNPTTRLYEFRRSDLFDADRAIEEYERNPEHLLGNLAAELESLAPLAKKDQHLSAKAYNAQYNEDKRMERCIVTLADLATAPVVDGATATYFDLLEAQIEREVSRAGDFEGIALYVICEAQADISKARDWAAKNESKRIVVALPTSPIAFQDALLNLKAIIEIEKSPEAAHFTTQDKALVAQRRKMSFEAVEGLRNQLLDSHNLTWLGAHGKVLQVNANKPDDAATSVMQQLYTRRATFSHDDFNLTHDIRNFTKPHLSLQEAVNALLKLGSEVTIDPKQPDNRGEIRYLQRCLYQRGALTTTHHRGAVSVVEVEHSLEKFESALPALADMIRDVQQLKEGARLSLPAFINKYRQPPYGQGSIALSLLFATLLRFFGDTIKIKKDDTAIGDMHIADFEIVADIIKGNYPNAFIQYREIQPGERKLINGTFGVFSESVSAAQANVTATNAYDAVVAWFEDIPPVAPVADFYQEPEYAGAVRFLAALDKVYAVDPHAFVLGELQTVAGYEADELVTPERADEILSALKVAKGQIEGTLERVQSLIFNGLCEIFYVEGNTWDDVADGIRAWYNGLDSNQRAPNASWHNEASKPLVQLCVDLSNPRDILLDKLPERPSYNFRRVRDWNANLVKNYLSKIHEGVEHIEFNRIKVTPPKRELVGEYREEQGTVYFAEALTLRLSHPEPSVRVLVTDTGVDPRQAVEERDEFQGSKEFDIARLVKAGRGSITIKYVAQDEEGNWGVTETLLFFDEARENEIHRPPQLALLKEGKAPVHFVFPTTEAGFVRACQTFFASVLETGVVDQARLRQLVQEILEKLPSTDKG